MPADHPHWLNFLLLLDIVCPCLPADINKTINKTRAVSTLLHCAKDAPYDTYPGMDYKVGIKILRIMCSYIATKSLPL